jgi:hypothetical protein
MPPVQQELALTEEQRDKVVETFRKLGDTMRESFGTIDFAGLQDLSDDEREKQFAEAGQKAEQARKVAEQSLNALLNEKQTLRLSQLRLQQLGSRALLDLDVLQELALSDDQRAQIEKLVPRESVGFGGFGPPPPAPAVDDKLLAVLDDGQRTTWAKLLGEKFEFPRGGPRGFGGPGGPNAATRKILAKFDANRDGWLNAEERKSARESLASQESEGGPFGAGHFGGGPFNGGGPRGPGGRGGGRGRGFGPPGGFGRTQPGSPGPHLAQEDVPPSESSDLYDPTSVRTLFLEFENDDWEKELEEFHGTDVDVPATLTVDGKQYRDVGVRFRGMSSYMMLPTGSKRSLNVSLDLADPKQRLYGYKTLNLLNAHEDPTFMCTVLYSQIARQFIPAPKANFVRVVINGESWGLYANAQQFDKIFVAENYHDKAGTRWKASGSPGADGGLRDLGDDVDEYRSRFEMKGKDNPRAWQALIKLCRTLNETPVDELEAALAPMLDIDGTLWFLALDNALLNSDGYWTRASDYALYLDSAGKFHVIPHDMNEALHPPMGPPGRGGPGGRPRGGPGGGGRIGFGLFTDRGGNSVGYKLDPLVGLDDDRKPLRSKLLAVPNLRAKYLEHVRQIANDALDWQRLGPMVSNYAALIREYVAADTRKLSSLEEFEDAVAEEASTDAGKRHNLHEFARQRREYLLNYEPSAAADR